LNWDSLSVVERDKLVRWFLSSLSPSLASRITRDVESAEQDEVDEEENNFAKIAAGIEPVMREDGQHFALRLQVLEGIVERNPEAFSGKGGEFERSRKGSHSEKAIERYISDPSIETLSDVTAGFLE
ncbi:MAG: hypothetical protein LBK99_05765, partial [Opitutaceae bacterium]|jgi:hypothetical protein|nr:hypothetical protein [Opitutaceae bacterium]